MSESLVVRLVRHAETASYEYDAGLTRRGRAQAHERAAQLAHALPPTHESISSMPLPKGHVRLLTFCTRSCSNVRLTNGWMSAHAPRTATFATFRSQSTKCSSSRPRPANSSPKEGNGHARQKDSGRRPTRWDIGCRLRCFFTSHRQSVVRRFLTAIVERTKPSAEIRLS